VKGTERIGKKMIEIGAFYWLWKCSECFYSHLMSSANSTYTRWFSGYFLCFNCKWPHNDLTNWKPRYIHYL